MQSLNKELNNIGFKNIKDFGVIGDGATNDTDNFIIALSKCNKLFIPNGIYIINTINLPDNTTILGESSSAIIKQNSTNNHVINCGNNTNIINLTIDGNCENKNGQYGCIKGCGKNNIIIDNCIIKNGIQWCVYFNSCNFVKITNTEICYCKNGAGCTIAGNNDGYNIIENCYSHNNRLDGIAIGQPYVTIKKCCCKLNGLIDNGACGIFMNSNAHYALIDSNVCDHNGGIGIEIAGDSKQVRIINNSITNNEYDGIEIRQNHKCIIIGNYLFNNGSPLFNSQISYSASSGNFYSVIDNNIIDCNGRTGYGIYAPNINNCMGNNIVIGETISKILASKTGNLSAAGGDVYELFSRKYIRYTDNRMMNIINAGNNTRIIIAGNQDFEVVNTSGGHARILQDAHMLSTPPNTPQNGDFYLTSNGINVYYANSWKTLSWK